MNDSTKLLIYLNQTVDFFCYIYYMTCIDLTIGVIFHDIPNLVSQHRLFVGSVL